MQKEYLRVEAKYVLETSTTKDQVYFADTGMMGSINLISKVKR